MIHHSTTWMTSRKDAENCRNGSAALPALMAATPMSREITRICNTLKFTDVLVSVTFTPSPKKFEGMTVLRKPSQEPEPLGSAAEEASTDEFAPGCMTAPTMMPMTTEKNAVMANHNRVCQARRAALVTLRRFAIEVTTAVNTSGGMSSFSSCT